MNSSSTVVIQSYRTSDVPNWISLSLQSVEALAREAAWYYEFRDDRFLELAPAWVRERCSHNLYALTDVCRLIWAREQLQRGFTRAIWVDADVLVFDPSKLDLDTVNTTAFAHESFVYSQPDGTIHYKEGLNNAFMVFTAEDNFLDTYLEACLECLKLSPPGQIARTQLGPDMLNRLDQAHTLNRIHGVGLFSAALLQEILADGGRLLQAYNSLIPMAPGAANLCHFLRNSVSGVERTRLDAIYEAAVQRLIDTRGSIFGD